MTGNFDLLYSQTHISHVMEGQIVELSLRNHENWGLILLGIYLEILVFHDKLRALCIVQVESAGRRRDGVRSIGQLRMRELSRKDDQ